MSDDLLEALKADAEAELLTLGKNGKRYVSLLETAVANAEIDAKAHWLPYVVVAAVFFILGLAL